MTSDAGGIPARVIGSVAVPPIGLGGAGLSLAGPPRQDAVTTVHAALDGGIRLLDTAAAYTPEVASPSHGERLLAEAVGTWDGPAHEVLVATKGGHRRIADGFATDSFEVCGRPDHLRAQAQESARALGVDAIDLYFLHWPDPAVPIAESMGALDALRREGTVRAVGLSNVTIAQVEEAAAVGPIAAVQNRFSPLARDEQPVLDWCAERGIAFLAYSPLGGLGRGEKLVARAPALASIASDRGVSPQQVALAWLVGHSPALLPIPGCRRPSSATDCAAALHLVLTAEERRRLDVVGV